MSRQKYYTNVNYILIVISGVVAGVLVLAVAFLALRESRICCRLFTHILPGCLHNGRGKRKIIRVMPKEDDSVCGDEQIQERNKSPD
ncbi:hypothetical protein PoB_002175700 [Plakobranchus ocellatus]|uniref:Uncharacterized protein n=1 Tax=Plakobranchus ocellatus TaxID=259542 RepID=A0AAV3ZIV2_9GAST|nr:hypothetical protein PoB_002175700 [Plakobranchus ocellatus]